MAFVRGLLVRSQLKASQQLLKLPINLAYFTPTRVTSILPRRYVYILDKFSVPASYRAVVVLTIGSFVINK